ncbi:hypothetical protein AAU61_05070 [Desulfocarbo indianensis]|nr:hypothetical protein AAU61_05070 [Desulfocarbo indianensis]
MHYQLSDIIAVVQKKLETLSQSNPSSAADIKTIIELLREALDHQTQPTPEHERLRAGEAEQEPRRSLYYDIFNQSPFCLFILDSQLDIITANQQAIATLSLDTQELPIPFLNFIEENHRSEVRRHYNLLANGENGAWRETILSIEPNDNVLMKMYSCVLGQDSDQQPHYFSLLVDNSNIKKVEEQLDECKAKLMETSIALKVCVDNRKDELADFQEGIAANQALLIEPIMAKLLKSGLNQQQKNIALALQGNLIRLTSDFTLRLSSSHYGLTHRELEVASLIRNGYSSDEIAEFLNLSTSAVLYHRNRIRKKLGMVGNKERLAARLMEFK